MNQLYFSLPAMIALKMKLKSPLQMYPCPMDIKKHVLAKHELNEMYIRAIPHMI